MTSEQRRQKLESFGHAPALLSAALCQFPKKMWLYRSLPERWSIHEIILHLADSEATCYVRCRHFIAEPGSSLSHIDSARWAGSLGYFHQSTREALEIIRRLRKMTYQLLLTVPGPVWSHTVEHPKKRDFTLEDWLDLQVRHIPHHVEQMKQNYEAWSKTHPPRRSTSRPIKPDTSFRMFSVSAGC